VKFYRVWELLIVASVCSLFVAIFSGTTLLGSLAGWLMGMASLLVVAGFARGRLRRRRAVLAARADANTARGQRLAHRIVAEAGTAGASVVIMRDRTEEWGSAGDSGRRNLAIDPTTRFEIGSLTKVFTGLLLAESVVRGEVGLEDPLGNYLPGIVTDPDGTVTLRSLATHTSGLPRLPRSARLYSRALLKHPDPYRGLDRKWLTRVGPATRRQEPTFSYSNFGYMLLGEALAEAAGQSWADLVNERICSVLAMTATSAFPDAHTAQGHNNFSLSTSYWHSSALPGAGALYSNTADLWRFLAAQLAPESTALSAAIKLSRQPHAPNIGLGWMLNMSAGIAWHNGGTGGFGAFMAVRGGSDFALAALTNSCHTRKLDRIAMECLRETTKEPVR